MAHYAKVVEGVVTEVITAELDFFETFVDSSPGEWLQTSYNTLGGIYYDPETKEPGIDQSKAFRKNYAAIGFSYDAALDAFIPPKLYNSWVLNINSCQWVPPIAMPIDGNEYNWNEETQTWILAD